MLDLNTVTVQDFKTQFYRDFPYISSITYDPEESYDCGDEVYYATNGRFYQALQNNMVGITPGSDPLQWAKYPDSLRNWVQDIDITNAFAEAQICFNQGLLGTDADIKLGYLYMTAHYLVIDLRNAAAGVSSTGLFPVASRGVGSVSEAYAIPDAYRNSPTLSMYTQTGYGMKYLALILPNTVGNMVAVYGGTNP